MKLLHTSDWHLGRVLHEVSLLEDQRHVLLQILDILKREPHDALIIAGDIYDRSLPSADAVSLLSWFLTALQDEAGIPVIMIPGNHDSSRRLSYCGEILSSAGIYISGDIQLVDKPVYITVGKEKAAVFSIPFLEQGSFYEEEKPITSHETAMLEAMKKIEKIDTGEAIRIGVAHCFAANGSISDSERKFVGGSVSVSPELFSSFDYTALGHLHRPQQSADNVYYSGSILKYSFSEYRDIKQVLSIDVSNSSCSITPISLSPRHDMVRIRGSFTGLLNNEEFAVHRDCYVEAELTDSLLVSNAISVLRKRFPFILSVKQQGPSEQSAREGYIDISNAKRDITDDFEIFHRYLYGEEPGKEKFDLFKKLIIEGNRT